MRFNKANVLAHIWREADHIRDDYDFTDSTGWAQVHGKGEDANRAYGEWEALKRTAIAIEDGMLR